MLAYVEMMQRYGKMLDKSIKIAIIPFLTSRLSSYWVDLITPVKASLARSLIDSLKHEATIRDETIKTIIPIKLKSFEQAIKGAREDQIQKAKFTKKRTYLTFCKYQDLHDFVICYVYCRIDLLCVRFEVRDILY